MEISAAALTGVRLYLEENFSIIVVSWLADRLISKNKLQVENQKKTIADKYALMAEIIIGKKNSGFPKCRLGNLKTVTYIQRKSDGFLGFCNSSFWEPPKTRKLDITLPNFPASCSGFYWFLWVAQMKKPVESEILLIHPIIDSASSYFVYELDSFARSKCSLAQNPSNLPLLYATT
jgi:hypothetical protein